MSDLFGGLMKGLSGLMPQNDPKTQLMKLQTEINDLKKQENELYALIGRQAVESYGLEAFQENGEKLRLLQNDIAVAEEKLEAEKRAQEEEKAAEQAARDARTCPSCGHENAEGTKFCQECGAKLGVSGKTCPSCGHNNPVGTKFCQECGSKLDSEPAPAVCPNCGQQNPPGTRFCGGCGTKLEV